MDLKDQAHRLRVLWKSGRDKYSSFYAVLGEVRKEIGNDRAFASWCVTDLRISVDVLANARNLLRKNDADIVKADLAAAKLAEKQQKRQAHAEQQQQKRQASENSAERRLAQARTQIAELKRQLAAAQIKPVNTVVNTRPASAQKAKPVNTKPSSDRNRDRHPPGYMREYMRQRRAAQKKQP
jgi:DNA anti-recombination protein RmuC